MSAVDPLDIDLLAHADYLAAYLNEHAWLSGLTALVDRDHVLEDETNEAIQKNLGGLILIGFRGWENPSPDSDSHRYTLQHGISLWTMPGILAQRELPSFSQYLYRLTSIINFWQPDELPDIQDSFRWRVGGGTYVPQNHHVVYEFTASIMEDFADPIPPFSAT